ncbi:ParB/RepB/Spo0J family partition protein [Ruminococcus sp. AF25-23LB]|nr:ParB/RepB/Spo0J family partition protein [Ruminococcus sp. AF25-23LB]
MVKQQCLFGTLLSIKVPGRHFLFPESWRKGVKMTEPNRQSGENEERIIEIEIERLRPFKEHPFQVKDDKEMFLLQESIEKYGILNPLIVRPVPDGYYEIISGHRRKHAAEKLGYRKVLVIIRVLSEDDSILSMVDSNLHRERISYSEKAFAYKMKQEAMKHQGSRTDLTLGQNVPKFKRTTEAIADGTGESYKQIQRYIRLTELLPELLDLLDNKKLQFTVAVNISYIDKEIQGWIYEYISDTGFIKPKQIAALRNQLNDGPINQIQMLSIFNNCVMAKKVSRSLTFSEKKLTKYFPDDYTAKDMEQVIESLLEKWMQEQSC